MKEANTARDDFCERSRAELRLQGVLDETEAISEAMPALGDNGTLSWRRVAELLGAPNTKGPVGDPGAAHDKLVSLGLIWGVGPADWKPGILSLCAYLVKHRGRRTALDLWGLPGVSGIKTEWARNQATKECHVHFLAWVETDQGQPPFFHWNGSVPAITADP